MRRTQGTPITGGRSAIRNPKSAFTLVELLVVIAIIGILAALLTAAASRAVYTARVNLIQGEITQFATAIEDYKNDVGSYPPNTQVDGASDPIDEAVVLANFKRHFKKAFPNHREPPALIAGLVGLDRSGVVLNQNAAAGQPRPSLNGGMTAAESLVFWMGGFSDDPKYPISGKGGPAYSLEGVSDAEAHRPDDVASRSWRLDIAVERLVPRIEEGVEAGFFDSTSTRYVTFTNPITGELNRINFWRLNSPNTTTPYFYFDASRSSNVTAAVDPPAATLLVNHTNVAGMQNFYAIKQIKTTTTSSEPMQVEFAESGKFQVLAAGLDSQWGVTPRVNPTLPADPLPLTAASTVLIGHPIGTLAPTFASGPWQPEVADTIANFANGTLEDAVP